MGDYITEITELAKNVPEEVLREIGQDELAWNKRFKWVEYTWNGRRTGRQVPLGKTYRENGTGTPLTETQFRQKREEYVLSRLRALTPKPNNTNLDKEDK